MKKNISWDRDVTHGSHPDMSYIRYKENLQSLKVMKPHLQRAFLKRAQKRLDKLTTVQRLIKIVQDLIYKLRMQANKKDGVPRN